jgi:hypothetical protein
MAVCHAQLREEINKYKVGAPARVGLVAPNDVVVPAGNTGLDPSQTSFFQVGGTPSFPFMCGLDAPHRSALFPKTYSSNSNSK